MSRCISLGILLVLACTPPEERDEDGDGVLAGEDCNDFNPSVGPPSIWWSDQDGDGFGVGESWTDCTQSADAVDKDGDCDDEDGLVHPDAAEACNHVDDDCDGVVDDGLETQVYHQDTDGDGFGDPGLPVEDCKQWEGLTADGSDCDDTNEDVFPGAVETCNGVDDDCDELVDDSAVDALSFYLDADDDGWGVDDETIEACSTPEGYVDLPGDCDEGSPAVNPGADEVCNEVDDDCDGTVDGPDSLDAITWYYDADRDDYGDPDVTMVDCEPERHWVDNGEDCDDDNRRLNPETEWYADDDGDGYGDPDSVLESCEQPSGYLDDDEDCDDTDEDVHPEGIESCDGIDNDCDGTTDGSDSVDATTWYQDSDGDGYGTSSVTLDACSQPSGMVDDATDCDDSDEDIYPGADEVCDDVDNDCDSYIDDEDSDVTDVPTWYVDADGDGYGDDHSTLEQCEEPSGYVDVGGDCDDTDSSFSPGEAEVCDLVDNDCDGDVDTDDADYAGLATYYADDDEDGYGDPDVSTASCGPPSGYTEDASDCDDTDDTVNPGATEVCSNGIDDNCDDSASPCSIEDLDLGTDADVSLAGSSTGDRAGRRVADAGDVDGDGVTDLLIGAPAVDDGSTSTVGAAYLVLGGLTSDVDLDTEADVVFMGSSGNLALGWSVAGAGDIDGDGYHDVLFGGPGASSHAGAAYIFLGDSSLSDQYSSAADVAIAGDASSYLGTSVDGAGDADADGYDDLLIGAYHGGSSYHGEVYLYLGAASPSSSMTTSDAGTTFVGESASDYAGKAVAGNGDTDGDGIMDIVIGATGNDDGGTDAGAAYVILGSSVSSGSVSLSSADAQLTGEDSGDTAGERVDIGGDVDQDGYGDIVVCAYLAEETSGRTDSGMVYVLLGPVDSDTDLSDSDVIMEADDADEAQSVGFVPDSDGDGYDEVIVGAPGASYGGYLGTGAAYLVLGNMDTGFLDLTTDADAMLGGGSSSDAVGTSVAGIRDQDGDELGELLVGAEDAGTGGMAYFVLGTGW